MQTLQDMFVHHLKDMLYAERQLVKALPKMSKKASAPELRKAIEHHLEETRGHVERLEQVFEMVGKAPRAITCEAIQGLVDEAKEIMEETSEPEVLDAGLIASAQAVEHYEISRYGTLVAWARQLGKEDAAKLLEETLEEEKMADAKLSELALAQVNRKAA